MRLYNFYRLVRVDDTGRVITGNELKEILTAEGFTIPACLPFPKRTFPPLPNEEGAAEAGIYSWADYIEVSAVNRLAYKAQFAEYFDQFRVYAEQLDADFDLARYYKDGNVRGYSVDVEIKYTFLRAATYLIQYKGNIEFICNNRFQG